MVGRYILLVPGGETWGGGGDMSSQEQACGFAGPPESWHNFTFYWRYKWALTFVWLPSGPFFPDLKFLYAKISTPEPATIPHSWPLNPIFQSQANKKCLPPLLCGKWDTSSSTLKYEKLDIFSLLLSQVDHLESHPVHSLSEPGEPSWERLSPSFRKNM